MTSRRQFLSRGASLAALAALSDVRAVFASELGDSGLSGVAGAVEYGAGRVPLSAGTGRLPDPADYLVDPGVRYLNHGSIGTIPRIVHLAHTGYLRVCESNPWLYMWDEPWVEPLEEVRRRGAVAMGCAADEVVVTHNTTEGFNLLAHGLPLGPGDEVLFSSLNHPGASNPWTHLAPERGFTVRRFDFPIAELPSLSRRDVVELHLREIGPRTRVFVFPHVDNLVGLRHPLRELAAGARERGVEFVAADGAQALSMVPVELAGSGVDFYAASPHKWVQSPKGLGLLFMARDRQDQVRPMWVSSGQGAAAGTIRRFEDYGTRNRPEVMALGDALAFQEAVGMAAREAHHRAVWEGARQRVGATSGLEWRSPSDWELSSALYLVEVTGVPSAPLSARLWQEEGIVFRPIRAGGVDGARLSPNLQNPEGDLEAFFRAAESAG